MICGGPSKVWIPHRYQKESFLISKYHCLHLGVAAIWRKEDTIVKSPLVVYKTEDEHCLQKKVFILLVLDLLLPFLYFDHDDHEKVQLLHLSNRLCGVL